MYIGAKCGEKFPKVRDPVGFIQKKKWNVRIVQKEGSLLSSEVLLIGHRKATDAIVKAWSKDIENARFVIEKITQAEVNESISASSSPNNITSSRQPQTEAHTQKKRLIIASDKDSDNVSEDNERDLNERSIISHKRHQPNATSAADKNINANPNQQHSNPLNENAEGDEDED